MIRKLFIRWLYGPLPVRTSLPPMDSREMEMRSEQLRLQAELGMDPLDSTQSWLRLHQLLVEHEARLSALEGGRK